LTEKKKTKMQKAGLVLFLPKQFWYWGLFIFGFKNNTKFWFHRQGL